MSRKLATVAAVADISVIPGADRIVCASVRGWDVVVKKDEFVSGDLCVYFEIDSFLPAADPRYGFLMSRSVTTTPSGVRGHVLKTAKLRGIISQGLALPVSVFPELKGVEEGADVSDVLGIVKYDPPAPTDVSGDVLGPFPSWLTKTDEERVQNLAPSLAAFFPEGVFGSDWWAYEKIDGMSMTVFLDKDGTGRVAGRNRVFKDTASSTMWRVVHELGLHERMRRSGVVALQGELFGPGIQGNPLRADRVQFKVFDVWVDGSSGVARRLPARLFPQWVDDEFRVPRRDDVERVLAGAGVVGNPHVFIDAVDKLRSVFNPDVQAEGVVFRHTLECAVPGADGVLVKASFKAINNHFLLKHAR